MTNKKNERVRNLMLRALDAMDELKKESPDHWRIVIIALYREAAGSVSKLSIEKLCDEYAESAMLNNSSLQERVLTVVHDAIVWTTKNGRPYDPAEIIEFCRADEEVYKILSNMTADVFNATFGKYAEEVIKNG